MFSYGEEEEDNSNKDTEQKENVFKLSEMKDNNSAIVKSKRVQKIIRFLEKSLSQ